MTVAEPTLSSSHTTRMRSTPGAVETRERLAQDLAGEAATAEGGSHAVAHVTALLGQGLVERVADGDPAHDLTVDLGQQEVRMDQSVGYPGTGAQPFEQLEVRAQESSRFHSSRNGKSSNSALACGRPSRRRRWAGAGSAGRCSAAPGAASERRGRAPAAGERHGSSRYGRPVTARAWRRWEQVVRSRVVGPGGLRLKPRVGRPGGPRRRRRPRRRRGRRGSRPSAPSRRRRAACGRGCRSGSRLR